MKGIVSLVGAGCADRDLITVRGLHCLQSADAVVYDDLLAEGLLEAARSDARLYYVGKRDGRHSMPQTDINALLIRLSQEGKTVCRLKGGDPFVFGRGGEEAIALREAQIPFRLVPGVSSCVAVPELWGIPVTHRGLSRSFHVVTAHSADTPDGLPRNFGRLAALDGTLVFLMGLGRIEALANGLIAAGKPADTPAAVVGGGVIRAALGDLSRKAEGFPGPAVLVVGPVAALDLRDPAALPLTGVTVGLTGTAHLRGQLRPALDALGAATLCVQTGRIEPACAPEELISQLDEGWDWIAFTSPNGVATFFDRLREGGYDLRGLAGIKFASVGPGTARALAQRGFLSDLTPERHDTASLGVALAAACEGRRVLLAGAENAGNAPEKVLQNAGIFCRRQVLYRLTTGALNDRPVDYLVFGSAGGVEHYCGAGGTLDRGTVVCIGQVTAKKARERGASRVLTAVSSSVQSLVEAIQNDLGGTSRWEE